MKKIRVADATNTQLDWLVAKALGHDPQYNRIAHGGIWYGWTVSEPDRYRHLPKYTADWSRMGPISEHERLLTEPQIGHEGSAGSWCAISTEGSEGYGPTRLVAEARCYVKSKLGDEAEVPEDLV